MSIERPTQGEQFKAADGTVYLVEDFHEIPAEDGDPATFMVAIVNADDADDMSALSLELFEDEWAPFVAAHKLQPA